MPANPEEAKVLLKTLLEKVLEDGQIDESEQSVLNHFYAQSALTVMDVRDVFGDYMNALRDDVMEDGVITDEERQRCRKAVAALKIPHDLLSPQMQSIVDG